LRHYRDAKEEVDPALPNVGSRWTPRFEKIASAIEGFRQAPEALHYAQRSITYDHREPIHQVGPLIPLYDDLVRNEFPWFSDWLIWASLLAWDGCGASPTNPLVRHFTAARYVVSATGVAKDQREDA
jgi:hypothetical protein